MNSLSPSAAVIVALVTAFLIWQASKSDTRGILQKQFAADSDPGGPYTACKVRFPLAEISSPCLVKVTVEGWYMVSPKEDVMKWRWTNNVPFLRTPVFIPWSLLDCAPAKFPMNKWMRFDVRTTKAMFFVPLDAATALLREADRPRDSRH